MNKLQLIPLIFLTLSGCAVITGGSNYNATVTVVNDTDAEIHYKGSPMGTGEVRFLARRKDADNFSVRLSKDGCKDQWIRFGGRKNRAVATALDVFNPFFLYFLIADAATGAWYKPDTKASGVSKVNFNHFTYHVDYTGCERDDYSEVVSSTVSETNHVELKESIAIDVDFNIPKTNNINSNAIAVVIGNSNYENTKNVDFAVNDAKVMKQYLMSTLGYKEENIIYVEDASYSSMSTIFGDHITTSGKLKDWIKPDVSDFFVYYSGHGAPGLRDKKGYFVPVDGDPKYIENSCYSADLFYRNLTQMEAKSMTIVVDACFSGQICLRIFRRLL